MNSISEAKVFDNQENIDKALENIKTYLQEACEKSKSAHEVEKEIWQKILAIGYEALGWYFRQYGDGDYGVELKVSGDTTLKKSEKLHTKNYRTVFGKYKLKRYVYARGKKQKIECIPLDSTLQLPKSSYSYMLQNWSQKLCVESPYGLVSRTLEEMLFQKIPVDTLEKMNSTQAKFVGEYRENKPAPDAENEGELMVIGCDAKGIMIRHEKDCATIHEHKNKRGPKPNRKKMATLAVSYTVDRFIRSPKEIIKALFSEKKLLKNKNRKRPEPQHKQVFASLNYIENDVEIKATETACQWMSDQVRKRNSQRKKVVILLMDGQLSLWNSAKKSLTGCLRIEILDLLHVTPKLWEVAQTFFGQNNKKVIPFIKEALRNVLDGNVYGVIQHFKALAVKNDLSKSQIASIQKICSYFKKNQKRMQYHQYLKMGYPIATGVLEGACRHFIKDRFERAGMRWSILGAQAMLDLRSVYLNEDWTNFMNFYIQQEQKSLYPHTHVFQKRAT